MKRFDLAAARPLAVLLGSFLTGQTRVIEYLLAWLMISWGSGLVDGGPPMMTDPHRYLLALMPEAAWGWFAISCGVMRLSGLVINGAHRRSPLLRMAGAGMGVVWWMVMISMYVAAIRDGVPETLLFRMFFVFLFFETYSVYRCGQDAAASRSFSLKPVRHATEYAGRAGYE